MIELNYKTKIFDTAYDLSEFLNANQIEKSDIVNISMNDHKILLVYL